MSGGFASLDILGNVSKPVMRKAGEHDVLSFSVAANMQRMRNGAKEEYTVWVRVQIWNKFAIAMAPHVQQGIKVFCRGEPELHKYTDNNGIEHTELRMNADILKLLGDKRQSTQHHESHGNDYAPPARQAASAPRQTRQAPTTQPANDGYGDDGDDIPF